MRFILTTVVALAAIGLPVTAQYRGGGPGYGSGHGYHDNDGWRDGRPGGPGSLRQGMSLMGRGELKVESRGTMPVSRIFVRQSNRGELTLAIDSYRGRDQVARAIVRKWKHDKIEADLVSFNGAPARGSIKIEFHGDRGYFEKAKIDGRFPGGKVKLDFRN